MELRQLAYFVAIAQSGTITAAAQKLHMSQPPLSLQLQKLEEELGCPLFERDTRHLRMTPAGELFYERAQGILQQCADLKREMADLQAGGRGLLRIGSVSSLNTTLLPRWVARFHNSYPQVRLELTERDSYQLLELVRNHRIDLALVRRPFSGQGLEIHPICSEPMCTVGQAHFFQGLCGPIAPSALANMPLLLYRRWEPVLMRYFAEVGFEPTVLCCSEDSRTALRLAQEGLGVACAPLSAARDLWPGAEMHPLQAKELYSEICAVTLRGHYTGAAAKNFIAFTQETRQESNLYKS